MYNKLQPGLLLSVYAIRPSNTVGIHSPPQRTKPCVHRDHRKEPVRAYSAALGGIPALALGECRFDVPPQNLSANRTRAARPPIASYTAAAATSMRRRRRRGRRKSADRKNHCDGRTGIQGCCRRRRQATGVGPAPRQAATSLTCGFEANRDY